MGVPLSYRVAAVNGAGEGDSVIEWTVIPTVPSAPQRVATDPHFEPGAGSPRHVAVSWSVPATDGGASLLRFEVSRVADGMREELGNVPPDVRVFDDDAVPATLGDLTYEVRAVNSVGASGPGTASVTLCQTLVGSTNCDMLTQRLPA